MDVIERCRIARPQFTLRALLVLMLAVGCFFGGIRFERERRRRADGEAARAAQMKSPYQRPILLRFDRTTGQ